MTSVINRASTPALPYNENDGTAPGWFYYHQGKVIGPTTYDRILALIDDPACSDATLVCRKGFERWYPLGELSGLLKAREHFREDAHRERRHLESVAQSEMDYLASLKAHTSQPAQDDAAERPTVEGRTIAASSMESMLA